MIKCFVRLVLVRNSFTDRLTTHTHARFMRRCSLLLPPFLRSEVGHVDSMMECLLRPDRYLITAIKPAPQPPFHSRRGFLACWTDST